MPYFTAEHLSHSLDYLSTHTHPALLSLLAMLKHGVPSSGDESKAINFGSTQERGLMELYFRPAGGPAGRPFYLPFGSGYGYTRWKDREYPGRTLQVQRDKHEIFQKSSENNRRWTLAENLADSIQSSPAPEVVGETPISAIYLAIWMYRTTDVASLEEAVKKLDDEFKLTEYGLVPKIFSLAIPEEELAIQLGKLPISEEELAEQLSMREPKGGSDNATAVTSEFADEVQPLEGNWAISREELDDLHGLAGMREPAMRALAALAAGMHVIFTGPPGSGKTKLAECLCKKAGFKRWTVAATDQWTTFETIGGYFPLPREEGGDHLDFLPGAVFESIEQGKCLIIDEINRADIDKAFGELFTLLSGNNVVLPYRRRSESGEFRRVALTVEDGVDGAGDLYPVKVPAWWRLIGSMNDADKASLKRLSMAFVRRFAFIPVDLPDPETYRSLVEKEAKLYGAVKEMNKFTTVLVNLFCGKGTGFATVGMEFGPAFPLAMIKHAASEWSLDPDREFHSVLLSAVELYVLPQFQGRPELFEEINSLLGPLLGDRAPEFERHLAVWTGYVAA